MVIRFNACPRIGSSKNRGLVGECFGLVVPVVVELLDPKSHHRVCVYRSPRIPRLLSLLLITNSIWRSTNPLFTGYPCCFSNQGPQCIPSYGRI